MKPYYEDATIQLWHGANLDVLPHLGDGSVDCMVTSPPYFALRDYGVEGQYGAEETPAEFVANLVATFREIRRVLAKDGTVWLNIGDSYSNPISYATGSATAASSTLHTNQQWTPVGKPVRKKLDIPPKNLLGMPWRTAFALQDEADGQSRGTPATGKRTLNGNIGGKNPGDVWTIPTSPFPGSHFATFPPELPRRCILAGCKPGGTVLDPFHGSGTTGMVAQRLGRKYVGIELNQDYIDLSLRTRLRDGVLDFEEPA